MTSSFSIRNAMALAHAFLLALAVPIVVTTSAQTNVTPAQYLASQPKPNFAPGNHLPALTRWGETVDSNTTVELANNWGYALTLSGYATPAVASNVTRPGTYDYGMAQLTKSNPAKYKLSVLIDRTFPTPIPNGFWCTNSKGFFVDYYSNTWSQNIYTNGNWQSSTNTSTNFLSYQPFVSPEGPDSYWQYATAYWMNSLNIIQSNAPIAIILNGGEYGLQTLGWGDNAWMQDARVQAQSVMTNPYAILAKGIWAIVDSNGMDWPTYNSNAKAHQLGFLTAAIDQAFPNRELSVFYNTDNEMNRQCNSNSLANQHWGTEYDAWAWKSCVMNTNTDLPSFQDYYGNPGCWTNPGPPSTQFPDLLTQHLNAVGFDINLGYKTNYSWITGGYDPQDGTTNSFSDIPHYMGFLKCLYTAGMDGAIAGYFVNPIGGLKASFPVNAPPQWLLQMIALAHVHALFSQLEPFTDNSDLISGPQHHMLSYDQLAYEFTNTAADGTVRVLARKFRGNNQWMITAWAAAGPDRTVSVNIPILGSVSVLARACGSVYQANTTNLTLMDTNGLLPSASFSGVLAPPANLHIVSGDTN